MDQVAWTARLSKYERQVGYYAEMLSELTGKKATGRIERVLV